MLDNKNNSKEKSFNLPSYIQIPFFLYKDKRLDKTRLLFTAWIYSLHTSGKKIKVKNAYLCEFLSIKERQLFYVMDDVEKFGYIKRIGYGCSRQIEWAFKVNSSISIEGNLNSPAQSRSVEQISYSSPAQSRGVEQISYSQIEPISDNSTHLCDSEKILGNFVGQKLVNPASQCTNTLHYSAGLPCTPVHPYNNIYNNIHNKREGGENLEIEIIKKTNPLACVLPDKYLLAQQHMTKLCLKDEKATKLFESKFGKLEVTLQEMLWECIMFYALKEKAQNVSPHRFQSWIKRENAELYDKRPDSAAHKLWRDLSEEEKMLIADYNHFSKHPEIEGAMSEEKKRRAKRLIEKLKQTQDLRIL